MKKGARPTSEEVILKAPTEHKLVNEQSVVILAAITNQLDQIGMPELAQKINLRLENKHQTDDELKPMREDR